MFKKSLTAAAIAGFLVLGGASAASAATYPPVENLTVSSVTVVPGGSITVTATGIDPEITSVTFSILEGPSGGTLASIVSASAGTSSPSKAVVNGSASAVFTASAQGTYSIGVFAGGQLLGDISVTVAAAGQGSDANPGAGLPATGSEVPAAALWLGVGAVGIGGIAIAAGVARRRAHTSN